MPEHPLDAVIVGFNDCDLQAVMASRARNAASSGGYRQMLGSVFRHGERWLHHIEYLNAVLREADGLDLPLHTMELPNLAVCHLQSFLARHGLHVAMVNFFNSGKARLAELLASRPRAVAVTTTLYVESDPAIEIVRFVRERSPETVVIAGGPHVLTIGSIPSLPTQDFLLNAIGADVYVHDAQGEATLVRVLHALRGGGAGRLAGIPNLVYRAGFDGGAAPAGRPFVRTPREPEDNDMDAGAVDWSLIARELYVPTASLIMSRSCPFRCSFCRYPALAGPCKQTGIEAVERQLRQLHAAGTRTVILFDDTPNVPLPRFKRLLNAMIANRFDFGWFANLRCTHMDAEAYDLLQASGCKGVFLGIESGDQRILDNMNKQARVESYRDGIRQLKERGILTYASFIVGFPGETAATVEATTRFIAENRPDYYQLHVYFHSRNVPIQQEAARFSLKGSEYSWRHATMDWQAACDHVDRMRAAIEGSIVGTSYLSTFWMIGYLYGLGVSLEHVHAFMRACRPALLRNVALSPSDPGPGEPLSAELLAAGREIAGDLRAAGHGGGTGAVT